MINAKQEQAMVDKQIQHIAGKLLAEENLLRERVWCEDAGVWVPMAANLVAEIRRQVKIRLDREERRYGGKFDPLALKIPGEVLHRQQAKEARAAGEPAPIPCL